jgi:hypothetical protein
MRSARPNHFIDCQTEIYSHEKYNRINTIAVYRDMATLPADPFSKLSNPVYFVRGRTPPMFFVTQITNTSFTKLANTSFTKLPKDSFAKLINDSFTKLGRRFYKGA